MRHAIRVPSVVAEIDGGRMRDRKTDVHRNRAQAKLGRDLTPDEVVHHVDENKSNNTPANLDVGKRGPHTTHHNQNRGLSMLRRALRMSRGAEKKTY